MKTKYCTFLILLLFFISNVAALENRSVEVTIHPSYSYSFFGIQLSFIQLPLVGGSVRYNIDVVNTGKSKLSELKMVYWLSRWDGANYKLYEVPLEELLINQSVSFETINYHISVEGDHTLHLTASAYDEKGNPTLVSVNSFSDSSMTYNSFNAFPLSFSLMLSAIGLFVAGIYFWYQNIRKGEIKVQVPHHYMMSEPNSPFIENDKNELDMELPLTFTNTGSVARSVDYLALFLCKDGIEYKFKPMAEVDEITHQYNKNIGKKSFCQFVVPPRSSIHKNVSFHLNAPKKKFEKGDYQVSLYGELDGAVNKWTELMSFSANLNQTNVSLPFDFWDKEIEEFKDPYYTSILPLAGFILAVLFLSILVSVFFDSSLFSKSNLPGGSPFSFLSGLFILTIGYFIVLYPSSGKLIDLFKKKDWVGLRSLLGMSTLGRIRIGFGIIIGILVGLFTFLLLGKNNNFDIVNQLLVNPLLGEFIYRGLLISILLKFIEVYRLPKKRIWIGLSLIISSMIFSWAHPLVAVDFFYYLKLFLGTITGILFGLLYLFDWDIDAFKKNKFEIDRNIWGPVAAHITTNFTIILLSVLL